MKKQIPIFLIFLLIATPLIITSQANPLPSQLFKNGKMFLKFPKFLPKPPKVIPFPIISSFFKSPYSLSNRKIIEFSKLSKTPNGTVQVGKELGELNLPNEVLEDTYMRILVHQNVFKRKEAKNVFFKLSNTPGFRSTLKKMTGNNPQVTQGHLNELRIAHSGYGRGFKVLGIGEKFDDELKKGTTDIDIVFEKGEKILAIEAKDYKPAIPIPMDKFRADLDTLVQYGASKRPRKVIPIFTMTNQPKEGQLKLLQSETGKRGIELIFGLPEDQIIQIEMLEKIK